MSSEAYSGGPCGNGHLGICIVHSGTHITLIYADIPAASLVSLATLQTYLNAWATANYAAATLTAVTLSPVGVQLGVTGG